MICFTCPGCDAPLRMGDTQAGFIACPICSYHLQVPNQAAPVSTSIAPTVSITKATTQTGSPSTPTQAAQHD